LGSTRLRRLAIAPGACRDWFAGIDVPDIALLLRRGVHRLIGAWMLMLVVYSASITFAAVRAPPPYRRP